VDVLQAERSGHQSRETRVQDRVVIPNALLSRLNHRKSACGDAPNRIGPLHPRWNGDQKRSAPTGPWGISFRQGTCLQYSGVQSVYTARGLITRIPRASVEITISIFTNSASRSKEQARAYKTAVLDLLGSGDPMQVLRTTPQRLIEAVAGLTASELSQREAPSKWSMREVVQHLSDAELVSGFRWRMVLAQDRPTLVGYDQDAWADSFDYQKASVVIALEEFRVIRRWNLRLLEGASALDLERVGVHAERGEETLAELMRLSAGHDLLHLAQLGRIRHAIRSEP
jgi:uncharacterized damage-inducible protein DinB